MYIFYSIIAVLVVLAIVLPLFYIYIISKARERLEKEVVSSVREEINALVREFNKISLLKIGMLENLTMRSEEILREVDKKESKLKTKKAGSKTTQATTDSIYTLNKKSNSYLSYSQELEARNQPSYVSIVDDNIEKDIAMSNQENIIFEMHNLGYSAQDIAMKINRAVGEVDLILSMSARNNYSEQDDE